MSQPSSLVKDNGRTVSPVLQGNLPVVKQLLNLSYSVFRVEAKQRQAHIAAALPPGSGWTVTAHDHAYPHHGKHGRGPVHMVRDVLLIAHHAGQRLAVVVFHGSRSRADWHTNLERRARSFPDGAAGQGAAGCWHAGFVERYLAWAPVVRELVSKLPAGTRVLVTATPWAGRWRR